MSSFHDSWLTYVNKQQEIVGDRLVYEDPADFELMDETPINWLWREARMAELASTPCQSRSGHQWVMVYVISPSQEYGYARTSCRRCHREVRRRRIRRKQTG
jgi:hypothetical protein